MRLATKPDDFLYLLKQAQQEAEAAFGNGAVYIERYVQNPRHIEFQARGRGARGGGALGPLPFPFFPLRCSAAAAAVPAC